MNITHDAEKNQLTKINSKTLLVQLVKTILKHILTCIFSIYNKLEEKRTC